MRINSISIRHDAYSPHVYRSALGRYNFIVYVPRIKWGKGVPMHDLRIVGAT